MRHSIFILGCVTFLAACIAIGMRWERQEQRGEGATIRWHCDWMRSEIRRREDQRKYADEFSRTNRDPSKSAVVIVERLFEWHPEKGDIELGYRSDGMVVWRLLPEGNK